jgi:hypothetical protein
MYIANQEMNDAIMHYIFDTEVDTLMPVIGCYRRGGS